jgi:MoaA/NifB/PqqE/SkfB family radical SAM enzyme
VDLNAAAAWRANRPAQDLPFDTACLAPWVALELDPAGWVYGCCANQTYRLGRIGEQRLPELWGGARMQTLRDALKRWDLSLGCQSCRWHIEHGRMDPDAAVYDRYEVSSEQPASPRAMTFALSNRCNLGCVMCNPSLSSTLRHQAGMPRLASPYGDEFFEDLAAFLPHLQYAKFLGGEPFLIPEHHRVWDLMEEVGGPPRLQVTTNGTIWNDRVEAVVSRFVTDITVSMDGVTAPTFEGIRRGARHDDVLANVERFRTACARSGAELRFCFCLMSGNWHELGAFLRWADEGAVPVSVNLVSDDGLALHDLPLDQLDLVAETWAREDHRLSRALRTNADGWRTQLVQLDAVRTERRVGTEPPSKQPKAVPVGFMAGTRPVRTDDPRLAAAAVTAHRGRLARWSGGDVGIIDVDRDRAVRAVVEPHARLGLVEPTIIGLDLDALIAAITRADGRPAWVLDVETFDDDDHLVRTIGLSTNPVRENPGSIVRMVEVPTDRGSVLLVAEDRLLDRDHPIPDGRLLPDPVRRDGAVRRPSGPSRPV